MLTIPFDYQKAGIEAIEATGCRTIQGDEMGLGKTIQALWVHRRNTWTHPALVICPAFLKSNWVREAAKHTETLAIVLEGSPPDEIRGMVRSSLYVISYDVIARWLPTLKKMGFQLVILDESQYLQDRNSKRTKAVKTLCAEVPAVIAMSGTPQQNKPVDLFPTLNIVWPDHFGDWPRYAHRYCKPERKPWGFTFAGATNLDELHERLVSLGMVRRRKTDHLNLPPKIREVKPVELTGDDGQYAHAVTDFMGWLRTHHPDRAFLQNSTAILAQINYLRGLVGRYKLPSACAWVDQFLEENPHEKIILFGHHRKLIEAIQRRYGERCVSLFGGMTTSQRDHAQKTFKTSKDVRVLAGNIRACGVGLNLVEARHVGFLELDWNPSRHNQAEDRIHRIGQEFTTWFYYLVAANTIDEVLLDHIQNKFQYANQVIDGGQNTDNMELLTMLLNRLGLNS